MAGIAYILSKSTRKLCQKTILEESKVKVLRFNYAHIGLHLLISITSRLIYKPVSNIWTYLSAVAMFCFDKPYKYMFCFFFSVHL